MLIDSPGWQPAFKGDSLDVRVRFDGMTAARRVNASVYDPLLCVVKVFKVALGNLSLPSLRWRTATSR